MNMSMDYGYIRNQIMNLAKRDKKLEISSVYKKICERYEEPRYEAIVETLIRISDARKVARMLIDGSYFKALRESTMVFKRNGVNNSELTLMLAEAGADIGILPNNTEKQNEIILEAV